MLVPFACSGILVFMVVYAVWQLRRGNNKNIFSEANPEFLSSYPPEKELYQLIQKMVVPGLLCFPLSKLASVLQAGGEPARLMEVRFHWFMKELDNKNPAQVSVDYTAPNSIVTALQVGKYKLDHLHALKPNEIPLGGQGQMLREVYERRIELEQNTMSTVRLLEEVDKMGFELCDVLTALTYLAMFPDRKIRENRPLCLVFKHEGKFYSFIVGTVGCGPDDVRIHNLGSGDFGGEWSCSCQSTGKFLLALKTAKPA